MEHPVQLNMNVMTCIALITSGHTHTHTRTQREREREREREASLTSAGIPFICKVGLNFTVIKQLKLTVHVKSLSESRMTSFTFRSRCTL